MDGQRVDVEVEVHSQGIGVLLSIAIRRRSWVEVPCSVQERERPKLEHLFGIAMNPGHVLWSYGNVKKC